MSTEIRVALVFEQDAGSAALRAALANAGVQVALERKASQLSSADALDDGVDAIVVNLDPELEDLLDEVTEVLDRARQPVIFNDPAASSDLSGWDRARWLRHLSAKLKGKTDVTPPPPPGAQAIPTPVRALEPAAAAAPAAVPQPAPAEPVAAASEPTPELSLADLDLMFEPVESAPPPAPSPSTLTVGDEIGDLDAFFAASDSVVDTAPAPQAAEDVSPATVSVSEPEIDLDALFAEAPEPAEPAVRPASSDELADLDALFSTPPATEAPASTSPASELTDLDALFREFEQSQAAEQPAAAAPAPAPAKPEPKAAPADWSLEPLLDLEPQAPAAAPAAPAPNPAPRTATGPAIPAELEASLALADLKLLDDTEAPAPAPEPAAPSPFDDLGSLDLSDIDIDAAPAAPARPATEPSDELALTDIDFDFDLGSVPSAAPASPTTSFGGDLSDLDALFEPSTAAVGPALSLSDLNRVFVLGASIGGPEAIKTFLARLPAGVPAAFIVAQHMGGEFLEMMAAQLDAATPLAVRYPRAGERLRHGEVVIAPAGEQLLVDEGGHLRMSAAPTSSPYNPSIDQIVRDAADRFGDHATLILFSGMGTDAIEGGRYLTSRGGQVWAQDRGSCVIATMIDSAKQQGLLRFEGSPVQLAERVMELVS